MPAFVPPQLPSLASKPPTGTRWIHEIKHDGYRTQILVDGGRARALTRNGHDWSAGYGRLVAAALELHCRSAIIDGEAIVQDESGASDFHALAGAVRHEPHRICMIAFDMLHLDGRDLRSAPLDERRGLLRALLSDLTRRSLCTTARNTRAAAPNCSPQWSGTALKASCPNAAAAAIVPASATPG